ncbi:UvrD-helicase domain-containing protein [Nannocystaceae bacterium ST9]
MSETDDQGSALGLELDANLVLAAGAGAGKTHTLVTVALALYVGAGRSGRAPLEPARVWAVTFTEKAARELRQRIVQRARILADDPDAMNHEPELAALLGEHVLPADRWRRVVEQLAGAPIGTFHALCGQLLRGFAVEAGIDPSFGVLEENAADELFERVLDEVLLDELEASDDSHTRAAARALGSPDTLRAALRRLHAKLGEEGRDPDSLLRDAQGLPRAGFDRAAIELELAAACRVLARAIDLLEQSREDRLRPTTRALAIERKRIGACEPERIEHWYGALVRVASQRRGGGSLPKPARRIWEPFAEAWERVQDGVAALAEQQLATRIVALLDRIALAYRQEKQRQGVLDFVDLVRRAHDLLRDDLVVRRQVKQRIGALLVDEFQDTNGLQLDLVHLLAEDRGREREVPNGARASELLPLGERVFAAVGDRKQSIYEFRGADVALFQQLAARARGREAGLRLHALRRSWRSRPRLVEFGNRLFARLLISDDPEGFAVDWVDDEDRLEPVREDHPAQADLPVVQLLCGDPALDLREQRIHQPKLLAEHLGLLLEARPPLGRSGPEGEPRPLRGADVAILFQSHTHVARYRRALSDRGIASIVVGGRGFHGAREVRELAALAQAIADPRDRMASAAVWRSPVWGIDDAAMVALAAADALALWTHREGCTVELAAPQAAQVTHMARLVVRLHHELDRLGPARTLRFAVDRLGLREVLAWDPTGEQRIANVDKLLGLLDSRDYAGLGALASARRLIERGEDPRDREAPAEVAAAADPNAVRIMTVHAAKGLEFPVVIVPELGAEPRGQDGPVTFERELGLAVVSPDFVGRRRPSAHAKQVAERLEQRRDAESRRLFYVAATRARDLLILLGEAPESQAKQASETSWRRMLDAVLPDLDDVVQRVDYGRVISIEGKPGETGMAWLLDRVAALRRQATQTPEPEALVPEIEPASELEESTPPPEPDPESEPELDTPDELERALARSEPLHLRACELDISLAGLAEFDKCPRRYLLSHVVGIDTPALAEQVAIRGLQLLPWVPRRRDDDEAGDRPPPSLAEARSRGRFVHYLLGRIDLDRLGRDPERALEGFADQDHIPDDLWREVRGDLLRFTTRPWMRELIAVHREDPRRVLRSLPFALALPGIHAADAPTRPDQGERVHLDLFAPLQAERAPMPEGTVIVRGRMDLVWIDDRGRLNLVDWQYAKAPAQREAVLDPEQIAGFRRLAQAWALRRLWGEQVPIAAGAVFLREAEADPGLVELADDQLIAFEQRLRTSAGRLLRIELGEHTDDWIEPWPKLDRIEACGECLHIGRCWKGQYEGESESPVLASEVEASEPVDPLDLDDDRR